MDSYSIIPWQRCFFNVRQCGIFYFFVNHHHVFSSDNNDFITITDTLAGDAAAKTNPVKMMTLHTVAVDLGAAIGPLLSFIIIDLNGISAVFYLSSMVMLFVGGAWGVFHFFGKKKDNYLA
ncbi:MULTISPECIES: hypothetical protein [Oceanobacillus]|uniref:Major Facilitator Superfamily protein n=1 Tax=Oceanobacillus aidingensis TaxID=645964 RepID=A0ABV9JYA3_9BACI|nr:hypothetical protein [Oceanobacillus oncorhynchi]MDM8100343.1 hypothetical protein [Oceanobacillus oncorhynchi]UUI40844.1 hypothetical protein NP440_04440 [Oceanobacillus oncorhynchi]